MLGFGFRTFSFPFVITVTRKLTHYLINTDKQVIGGECNIIHICLNKSDLFNSCLVSFDWMSPAVFWRNLQVPSPLLSALRGLLSLLSPDIPVCCFFSNLKPPLRSSPTALQNSSLEVFPNRCCPASFLIDILLTLVSYRCSPS